MDEFGVEASRKTRQVKRRDDVLQAVMADGAVHIDDLAKRFGVSLMTIHRDLDELESRGILRKSRGIATASGTSLVESSAIYRSGRQVAEKALLAKACIDYIEPGQSILLDDSTTVQHLVPLIPTRVPLTIITNSLPLINELHDVSGVSLVALGGTFQNWCSAFMGYTTTEAVASLRADTVIMSTAAVIDDWAFHQQQEAVDVKKAMLDSAATKILLVDHTKFEKRALHRLVHLSAFDIVIVDSLTSEEHITRLRGQGINVVVVPN